MSSGPILIISGTNRPNSNAMKIARILEGHYKSQQIPAELFSLIDLPREIFDNASYANKPASFAPIQEKILNALGLHIVTPEYNGGFPGVLKYFIDMLKFPESFEDRPVAFVGEAGRFGALRPVEQLQVIFGYRNAFVFPSRVFIQQIKEKFDADGNFTDEAIVQRLADQARDFAKFASCVSALKK